MQPAQASQYYKAPHLTHYPYRDTQALNNWPPTDPNSLYLHCVSTDGLAPPVPHTSYLDPYDDPSLPTLDMLNALFSASTIHKDAFDAIYSCNATDSDFAIVGQTISPPRYGEEPKHWIFYARLGRKTIHWYVIVPFISTSPSVLRRLILWHSVQGTLVRWFGRWRMDFKGIEASPGPFSAERLDFLKSAACECF